MLRKLVLLSIVVGAGIAGMSWMGREVPPAPVAAPAAEPRPAAGRGERPLETPFADARFRATCTVTLRERLADQPAWPLHRVASLCLCLADAIREGRERDLAGLAAQDPTLRPGELLPLLAAVEARACPRRDRR